LNAAFAAFTAKSTSALSPSEISAIFFSVAGLSVENVFLLTASTNSLLMKSYQFKKKMKIGRQKINAATLLTLVYLTS
jgi:hypothetical protein